MTTLAPAPEAVATASMDVGYLIDLEKRTDLTRLQLLTKTPGFTLQVFGSDAADPPAKADDPAWTKLAEAGAVDGDAPAGSTSTVAPAEGDKAGDLKLVLKLGGQDKRYRHILLWVTTPPAAGTTVRFSEIKLWG